MIDVQTMMHLMEKQARQCGIALCPINNGIYAKLDRLTNNVFWIGNGHRVAAAEVEQTLRNQTGFLVEVNLKGG
ncbi:hypothetical protein [Paraburkholderia sp. C35]|uniref:hypothetical protein n=1 Tax=Paraburkholderia sp. C35 TaxID=2126993 RepID=UPI000D687ED0|nr:hypothetical protein [Paraburkholderia sp. C35]